MNPRFRRGIFRESSAYQKHRASGMTESSTYQTLRVDGTTARLGSLFEVALRSSPKASEVRWYEDKDETQYSYILGGLGHLGLLVTLLDQASDKLQQGTCNRSVANI